MIRITAEKCKYNLNQAGVQLNSNGIKVKPKIKAKNQISSLKLSLKHIFALSS